MDNIEYIDVPYMKDTFSTVTLDGRAYLIRFNYNSIAERWRFSIYDMQREPIAIGLPIVPRFPLNLQVVDDRSPRGVFVVYSNLEHISKDDFKECRARFAYIPYIED